MRSFKRKTGEEFAKQNPEFTSKLANIR